MRYFERLRELLAIERVEDTAAYRQLTASVPASRRRDEGLAWYPVAIRGSEVGRGDYLTVELERTTHRDQPHSLRFGAPAALFSNHNPTENRLEGTLAYVGDTRLKITLRTDELPDWASDGKLGVDVLFDNGSYEEMEGALRRAEERLEDRERSRLTRILTGSLPAETYSREHVAVPGLNPSQEAAVNQVLAAADLAIIHGPPGTGKTTTLVQAVRLLVAQDGGPMLVTAPSNTAVDLLSERLAEAGLNVVRVGNPVRVSERLAALTLDGRMAAHPAMKDIKKLKKQAAEFRTMAHKYKRTFGKAEREQRKALFDEAHRILKDVGATEQYITNDLLGKADVVAATLVGAAHHSVRHLRYKTAVIDEAGQALEPACWIPALKAEKLVLAGDHLQLPPTVKSARAAAEGLSTTLLEKCVALHPEMVTLLEEQYRMNEAIMGYSSQVFYDGRLRAAPSVAHRTLFEGDAPLVFIDTAGCGFEEQAEGTSVTNPEEAGFVLQHLVRVVDDLVQRGVAPLPTVAVIAPYAQQVRLLREQAAATPGLDAIRPGLTVNTVDGFQGGERDLVCISLTRSNSAGTIGFLADVRRMNVALTRARKKLVVVGDSATLSGHPFYAGFIAYAQERDAYHSAWEFMDL